MKAFLKVFVTIISILYPVLLCVLVGYFHIEPKIVSLCVVIMALVFFLSATSVNPKQKSDITNKKQKRFTFSIRPLLSAIFLFTVGTVTYITNKFLFLRLYPVIVSLSLLSIFGISVINKPTLVYRMAILKDKHIVGSINEHRIERYCNIVNYIWCIHFILNILVSLGTVIFTEIYPVEVYPQYQIVLFNKIKGDIWTIYNGGISYGIMFSIFTVEFIVRWFVNKSMAKIYPITKFTAKSRKDDFILCYEEKWSSKKYKTWKDFLTDTAKLRTFINTKNAERWILHVNDYYFFLCSFVALLQCKKQVALTANISEEFIKEMKQPEDEFLTDAPNQPGSYYVPDVIANIASPSEEEIRTTPAINADETKIHMFTSGSTGKPKVVLQRMTEFEMDNAFVLSMWGEEFLKRKHVATVSQHHIYGFLFTISLPFTAGIPFRRTRIEFPTEFEKLDDEKYTIIAVPAFLKRTIETEDKLDLIDPFIITSGGVLLPEVAKKTNEVFGFWPVEVYGSTETSGIAHRQSKNGLEWTPFANALISKNEDGCLNIKSPYIKDPNGFQTADLVDILEDGRFILKGRADSIVKIEEKRISLPEVESRILQTGLVKDVCVVAMSDRRQYLAAALVFNKEGEEKFKDWKKFDINMFFHDYLLNFFENVVLPKKWRYLSELPMDLQGKKKKLEIQALFTKSEDGDKIKQ